MSPLLCYTTITVIVPSTVPVLSLFCLFPTNLYHHHLQGVTHTVAQKPSGCLDTFH
ncbi:hypothetical protein BS17DRAFT_781380 [Gyrodon lividus]|nr:hypothetical protein BS17DRAFT_781380 [Gyrodon lividus]